MCWDTSSHRLRSSSPVTSSRRSRHSIEGCRAIRPTSAAAMRLNKVELFPSALHGYKLLRLEPKLTSAIFPFLETTLKNRPIEWTPEYNLTPVTISDPQMVLNTKSPDSKKEQSKTKDVPKNASPGCCQPQSLPQRERQRRQTGAQARRQRRTFPQHQGPRSQTNFCYSGAIHPGHCKANGKLSLINANSKKNSSRSMSPSSNACTSTACFLRLSFLIPVWYVECQVSVLHLSQVAFSVSSSRNVVMS